MERLLTDLRPHVRTFLSGGAVEALASGQACLALTYSGDVVQAGVRAREAGRPEVRYVAPKEFAQLSFDVLAIPADAPHPDDAHRLVAFLLQPDVMAAITNRVRYPNAVPASLPMVWPEVRDDRNVFPTAEDQARMFTVRATPQAAERARTRMWTRFKAGG